MKIQISSSGNLTVSIVMVFMFAVIATAQNIPSRAAVVAGNNLYCAGFIQTASVNTSYEIVGAEMEADKHIFSEGDNMIVNFGANRGARVGDVYSVIRPRGQVKSKWTRKNNLGFYVQEIGLVEIVNVKNGFSVARVKTSCDNLLLGDLLTPINSRSDLAATPRPKLEVFGDSSGKAAGRIILARDGQEMLARDQIVFVDLGREDNVRVGDYLTVFRPLGTGNIFDKIKDESVNARSRDYQSDEYRGGKFSNQAARKSGDQARDKVVTTESAKSRRPDNIRRVVGELVILNVKEKTATAMVVRASQEIHTGDYVELQ